MKPFCKLLAVLFFISAIVFSQSKKYQAATVMLTNVENLWDTINSVEVVYDKYKFNDPLNRVSMGKAQAEEFFAKHKKEADSLGVKLYIKDQTLSDEFTPNSIKNWNSKKYFFKLNRVAQIILEIGQNSAAKSPPVIVGMVEVENRQVLEDLVNIPSLKPYNYGIAHLNSSDSRGIDVCFIYRKDRFEMESINKYIVNLPLDDEGNQPKTRDIVTLSGKLDGESFTFIANHWPSRRGGEARSAPLRAIAGNLLKSIFEERLKVNPSEKIIAMGDFNDDPVSPSVKKHLGATSKKENLKNSDIYGPMEDLFKKGFGTLAYQDAWNLFDQILFSGNLIDKDYSSYKMFRTEIYSPKHLVAEEGQFKGYPKRSWNGDLFVEDGYSDHFPVYTVLLREVK